MEALQALLTRSSVGVLQAPAPGVEVLQKAFAAALRAPDHRMLRPWRFITIQGEGLNALGELFVSASRAAKSGIEEAEVARLRAMPLRAPLIIVAVATFKDDPKVPRWEQMVSTGAAVQNLMVALHAQGFGSMWRTGSITENADIKQALGLKVDDMIVGFVYVGTPGGEKKINPLDPADYVRAWPL
jgi:nitroreductase